MLEIPKSELVLSFAAGALIIWGAERLYATNFEWQNDNSPELERRQPNSVSQSFKITTDHDDTENIKAPVLTSGIEGLIGNTPLIRINSLSEATGCEILAKAEV
jgi:hypothetical protein